MRRTILLVCSVLFAVIIHAQANRKAGQGQKETFNAGTNLLPEGAIINNGKVTIKKGYQTQFGDSSRVIIVKKPDGNITGAFSCSCKESQGGCGINVAGSIIVCVPNGCSYCEALLTTVNPVKGAAITKSGSNWKEIILPAKN